MDPDPDPHTVLLSFENYVQERRRCGAQLEPATWTWSACWWSGGEQTSTMRPGAGPHPSGQASELGRLSTQVSMFRLATPPPPPLHLRRDGR